ncbi:MAG: DMT family transporter, partial [Rhodospirillales bacterium]
MTTRDWMLIAFLSLIWGGSFFFAEVALLAYGPLTVVALRVSLAAAILLVILRVTGKALPRGWGIWGALAVMGLLNNVFPFSLIVWGQVHVTSSIASIFNATTPLFTVFVAHLLTTDERMTVNKLVGVLLGIAGVVVMIGPSALAGFDMANAGQVAVLGGALSYAFASIWGRRLKGLTPMVAAAGMLLMASVVMIPAALLAEQPLEVVPSPSVIASVIGLASVSTALAYLIYFRLLATAGSTNLMLVTLLIPISAMALGISFLDETPGAYAYAGMLLIFAGLISVDGRL